MPRLILTPEVLDRIRHVVQSTEGETGVRLIGEVQDSDYSVLHVIEPGDKAVQGEFHYECDNDYAERIFGELLEENPNLQFLGELHVHPSGSPDLSTYDLRTVRRVLKEYPFFIAGVLQREPFAIYPVLFRQPQVMKVECVLYQKPEGTGDAAPRTSVNHRVRERGVGDGRHARQGRNRETHPDRS